MNTRDPFNLRPSTSRPSSSNASRTTPLSLLQRHPSATGPRSTAGALLSRPPSTTSSAASSSTTPAASASTDADGPMAFQVPRNVPSFDAPQRRLEDNSSWSGSGRSRFPSSHSHTHNAGNGGGGGAYAEKYAEKLGMGGVFGGHNGKELPMYKDKPYNYARSRRKAWHERRRVVVGVVLGVLGLMYWAGFFGGFGSRPGMQEGAAGKKSGGGLWGGSGDKAVVDWEERREAVRDAFKTSWAGYEKYAWGFDEYHPLSKNGRNMVDQGMGWIIVDALDTLILMNLTTELTHAREWLTTSLNYEKDHDVNTFETTIRMLGGLLSAHYLSTEFPHYAPLGIEEDSPAEDLYLEKATDLADRLISAYESPSGVPYASVNLDAMKGIASHADGGASSTAEATTLQLEMKYLAKLTGEDSYWDTAEIVMQVVDDNGAKDGLVPIFIYAHNGMFRGNNVRLGSRGDSYYEYLIKQYLQTSKQEPIYLEMWDEALAGIRKHLLTYSHPSNFTVLAERPSGLDGELSPKMDHLVCFLPGTIALAATGGLTLNDARSSPAWGPKQEADLDLARELMKTCWGMYKATATGLAPEIAHFNLHDPPVAPTTDGSDIRHAPDELLGPDATPAGLRDDFVLKPADTHNLQRPETVESLFYMWRITGEEQYREWGWAMFEAFMTHTKIPGSDAGFTSIDDVRKVPPPARDNMESFWLAETLKYFYLLFGPTDVLPLDDVVLNTEAHPFPRFELGKLFTTGWQRKPRDADGNIILTAAEKAQLATQEAEVTLPGAATGPPLQQEKVVEVKHEVVTQTVQVVPAAETQEVAGVVSGQEPLPGA